MSIRAEISTLFKFIFKIVTHPVGIMTKVEFITHPNTLYTGCLKGAKHVVMRISDSVLTSVENPKTIPGHGIKPDPNETNTFSHAINVSSALNFSPHSE